MYGWNIGYVPVVAGYDRNYMTDRITDSVKYTGHTFTTGFGTSGFEGHVDRTHTGTLPHSTINIFDSAEALYDAIMEW